MPESYIIEPIEDNEHISRFLTSEDEFDRAKERVRHNAFKPPRNRAFSTYRTEGLDNRAIWDIGQRFVTALRSDHKEVLARAELKARIYKNYNLRLNPDGNPHARHVNIEGWPTTPEDLLDLRKKLANEARLFIK